MNMLNLSQNSIPEDYVKYKLGTFGGVEVVTILYKTEEQEKLDLRYLPDEIKRKIRQIREKDAWWNEILKDVRPLEYEIDHNTYYELINLKYSVILNRSISNNKYCKYLFQSLTTAELKQIFREKGMKGYSKLTKSELIEFLVLNLAEEEKVYWLMKNEHRIIQTEINQALAILKKSASERLKSGKILTRDHHELEFTFEGKNWTTTSFLSITPDNIADPERDCDCRTGSNGGFCPHFWVGFLYSLKLGWVSLDKWKLTHLPNKLPSFQ